MFEIERFKDELATTMQKLYAKSYEDATNYEKYTVLVKMVSSEAWQKRARIEKENAGRKKVYYFSLEFLTGKLLENYLCNIGILEGVKDVLREMGDDPEDIFSMDAEPGLGNGGLGRLAACFLDSMASLGIAGEGMGLRYKFGLFRQKIVDGKQKELPDPWLENGFPWEVANPDSAVIVKFGGRVDRRYENGKTYFEHKGYDCVLAVPVDVPIVGEGGDGIGVLHLFDAKQLRETINMEAFNRGDYAMALKDRCDIDAMTSILYPDDSNGMGKRLRLRQEYLLTAAGLGMIVQEYREKYGNNAWDKMPERVSIHINDTHPTLCIPELMRILIDDEGLEWDDAWKITFNTISFTNHTVLSEALEKWPIDMLSTLLPRVYMMIEEIDRRFKEELSKRGINDINFVRDTAILWNGEVRMANLSVIGTHSTNGVAALHTKILKEEVFRNFYSIYPERFNNKTNGISHRRFLIQSNPELSKLLDENLGEDWRKNISKTEELITKADDPEIINRLFNIKRQNKIRLAEYLKKTQGVYLNPDSIFDIQVKRMHAYKRQLLFALKILDLYNRLLEYPNLDIHPHTFIFAGKAAQGYAFAKDVIYLINVIAKLVNEDGRVNRKINVVFVENFCVGNAQLIYPAADISEQISTAGKEASGTGNMKFMMNGAVTLGTLDGANVEIKELVGEDNIKIFGLLADETRNYYLHGGYNAYDWAEWNPRLKKICTQLVDGTLKDFSGKPVSFWGIYDALFKQNDEYFVLRDFESYVNASEELDKIYSDRMRWGRMSLINIAKSAYFSSDRTIKEYAGEIWRV